MRSKAAVAARAGAPLEICEVEVEGPREGEILVEIKATGVCHTDAYTLSGADPEGLFPAILGHEGAGVVIEIGRGVKSLAPGDHVIPLYTPECRQCKFCLAGKTNLCSAIRETQGRGVMPDGTSRFSLGGKKVHHYMGTSTFSNFTVLPEIAAAKIREDAPFDKVCYIGCGVTTGIGAAWRSYDPVSLVETASERLPILVDQGSADPFLESQLRPDQLLETCRAAGHPSDLRLRDGYDHSYYFVASFLEGHFDHHARALDR